MIIFERYWNHLLYHLPNEVLVASVSFLVVGFILCFIWYNREKALIVVSRLLLIETLFIVYSSTLIFRKKNVTNDFNYTPFWSYKAILDGKTEFLSENIMNVLVFVPIGLLLAITIKNRTWLRVLLTGITISVSIEIMQFLFKRGFSEIDDVIHNVVGCLIGYCIFLLFCKCTFIKILK